MTASIVFVNGTVITMDGDDTIAEAVAVEGTDIVAVGSRALIDELTGPGTRVVDLAGGTVIPGINDSHIHAIGLGVMMPPLSVDVGYPAVSSIADVVAAVREQARRTPAGDWIVGGGWDYGFLAECVADPSRAPLLADLDAATTDHPVVLNDFSLHATWVNTAALRAAGYDPDGDYRDDYTVLSGDDGRPTGVLHEGAAGRMRARIPAMTDEFRRAGVLAAARELTALGVTSITDPAIGPVDPVGAMAASGIEVYRRLVAERAIPLRVCVLRLPAGLSPSPDEFERNLAAWPDEPTPDRRRFAVVGTKIFADGIPPNLSAWMYEDYTEGRGCGALVVEGDTDDERVAGLNRMIELAHRAGHQIGVHTTGDRSADAVVDAFVAAVTKYPRPDPRHYVIHADFLTPHAIAACAEHGFGANMNPAIKWTIADFVGELLGPQRAAYEWPYRSAIDGGVAVTSASDAPVTFPNWRQGLSTMLLRESKATGTVSGPDERIGLLDALRTYTAAGAWQDRAEDWKGSIEAGKVADLCVIGADLVSMDPADMPEMPIVMTVFDGEVVHEAPGGPADGAIAAMPTGGHYGTSTRLVPSPGVGCCQYDALTLGPR
ncbi:MAG: amidohydrolase [Desertimonas sp.]